MLVLAADASASSSSVSVKLVMLADGVSWSVRNVKYLKYHKAGSYTSSVEAPLRWLELIFFSSFRKLDLMLFIFFFNCKRVPSGNASLYFARRFPYASLFTSRFIYSLDLIFHRHGSLRYCSINSIQKSFVDLFDDSSFSMFLSIHFTRTNNPHNSVANSYAHGRGNWRACANPWPDKPKRTSAYTRYDLAGHA